MANAETFDFYGDTPLAVPHLVYRRLGKAVHDHPEMRTEALDAAIRELASSDPRMRKFRFIVPGFLKRILTPQEVAPLEAEIAPRARRATRLKMTYPLSADEFSLDSAFLTSVLDFSGGPQIPPDGRFFTIGSCFATNIMKFLVASGYQAKNFGLLEELNSPVSNAFLFDVLQRPAEARPEAMADGIQGIFPEMSRADAVRVAAFKVDLVRDLADQLAAADCVVLTLGNVIDFFRDDVDPALPLMDRVFPKYLAMSADGDMDDNLNAATRLKKVGATLRMATHAEACEAITSCVAGIRSISKAPIVVSLSPVPVDSAIGLEGTELRTAIEVDCVSKSRLRSAFEEITPGLQKAYGPIHYFPSYEIVRWLAPMLSIPSFGREDALARHVSGAVLDAICSQFIGSFIRWTEAATQEPLPAG